MKVLSCRIQDTHPQDEKAGKSEISHHVLDNAMVFIGMPTRWVGLRMNLRVAGDCAMKWLDRL